MRKARLAMGTTYTVWILNNALRLGHYCGTFASEVEAETYIRAEQAMTRDFVAFSIYRGTPREPRGKVRDVPRITSK